MRNTLAAIAVLAACGPRASRPRSDDVPWASSGVDWSHPPRVTAHASDAKALPTATEATLANGVRVIVVENHRLPLVAVTAVHLAAGGREDGDKHGLAALTASSLVDGTDIEAVIASDHASHELVTTTDQLDKRLDELVARFRTPQLDDSAIIHARLHRLDQLAARRENGRTVAAQAFDHLVFGEHPYAWPAEGSPEVVNQLGPADVAGFWARAYRPDSLVFIFAGDVTSATARTLVEQRVGSWSPNAPAARSPAPAMPPYARALAVIDRPGATDAVVIVGRRLDRMPTGTEAINAEVGSAIVGDGTVGRLQHRLHDELALTIGSSAGFWRGEQAWTWSAAATFRTERALDGVRELLDVISSVRTTDARDSEVAVARTNLELALEQQYDTNAGTARALERLVARRLPLATYGDQLRELPRVAAAGARHAMDDAWSDLSIVIVGDKSKLGHLDAFGLPIISP